MLNAIQLGFQTVSAETVPPGDFIDLPGRGRLQGLRLVQDHARELALVITDLVMPLIDSFEVAEVLSIFQPDLPVLVMSGHATVPDPDRRLTVIKKPFSVSSLIDAVRAVKSRPHGPPSLEQRARAQQAIDLVATAFELRRLRNQP